MVFGFSGIVPNAAIGLLSILLVVLGADKVVNKIEGVAKYYEVSEIVIAMTIISIGTSLPEISLHVVGSYNILLQGSTGAFREISSTVLGGNIGSDIVQQTLVLGLVVLSSSLATGRGFNFSKKFVRRDYLPMVGASVLTLLLVLDGFLSRLDGLILVGTFVSYMYYLYTTRNEKLKEQGNATPSQNPAQDMFIALLGMGVVLYSADVFLRVTEIVIKSTGLSGSMIGVAVVGVVSAMPEMTTALSGVYHEAEGISLGTLIGSNIVNPLMGIGLGALISTYTVPRPIIVWDLPLKTASAIVLLGYLLGRDTLTDFSARLARSLGLDSLSDKLEDMDSRVLSVGGALLLVILYVVYLYVRWQYFPSDF
ncbi:MAG: sodium:calcium antiporter [Candidatus Nanosalina sp.]